MGRYLLVVVIMVGVAGIGMYFNEKDGGQPHGTQGDVAETSLDPESVEHPVSEITHLEEQDTVVELDGLESSSDSEGGTVEGTATTDQESSMGRSTLGAPQDFSPSDKQRNLRSSIAALKGARSPDSLETMLGRIRNKDESLPLRWRAMEEFRKLQPNQAKLELEKLKDSDPLKRLYRSQQKVLDHQQQQQEESRP